MVDLKVLEKLPDQQITLICTGSQGEPMAALSRMANRDHMIRIGEGDTVLLASSLIPGNENAIYRVINSLTRWGANVVHKGNAKVHTSGHASAGELVYCYNIVRPRNVMPVHGEWRHLMANGALAVKTGLNQRNVILAEDGVVVDLVDGLAQITGKVAGRLRLRRRPDRRRRDRGVPEGPPHAGRRGLHHHRGRSSTPTPGRWPSRRTSWPAGFVHDETTFDTVVPLIEKAMAKAASEGIGERHQIEQLIRRTVSRWANDSYRRSPIILPIVIDA